MRATRPSSLLMRLLVAYLVPTLALLALFGWFAHRETERILEESLGRRLIGIAQAAATQLRPEAVLFLGPGDDASRTAQRLRHRLLQLQRRTGVARIFILDRELHSRSDTQAQVKIGDHYYHAEADRSELARVFKWNEVASSVLFSAANGRLYKTGYAPLAEGNRVLAVIGVDGSAEFFGVLARLRRMLLLSGLGAATLIVLVSITVARRITRPLRALAREAERIGGGELERPIAVHSSDEVGLLASTMNKMRQGLFDRDLQLQMMLAGIAHEVRNPLGGIELFSGLLREELQHPSDADKLQCVNRIERELAYLKKVVGDFLDYARRSPPQRREVDLAELLGEVVEVMGKDASEVGVGLNVAAAQSCRCQADPEQLRSVLINLTRNALQATPRGGTVSLRCGSQEQGVYCTVEDTGSGITPEHREQIFTPFFTTREKGTGLGLALARKIVEQHGGQLLVESEPGAGSRFTVSLPKGRSNGDGTDH